MRACVRACVHACVTLLCNVLVCLGMRVLCVWVCVYCVFGCACTGVFWVVRAARCNDGGQARALEAGKAQEIAALDEELAAANKKLRALHDHAQHTTALSTLAFKARAKVEAQWRQWQVRPRATPPRGGR